MLVIAQVIAITCYIAAAGLAAAPFARPIAAPVRGVIALLSAGVAVHLVALLAYTWQFGEPPLTKRPNQPGLQTFHPLALALVAKVIHELLDAS